MSKWAGTHSTITSKHFGHEDLAHIFFAEIPVSTLEILIQHCMTMKIKKQTLLYIKHP